MTVDPLDPVEFDELIALALAQAAGSGDSPGAGVKERLMSYIAEGCRVLLVVPPEDDMPDTSTSPAHP